MLSSPSDGIREMNNKIATDQLLLFMKHDSFVSYFTAFGCDGIAGFVWICVIALLAHHNDYCKSIDIPASLQPTVVEPFRSFAADSRRQRTS